jgi:hypothetical protein
MAEPVGPGDAPESPDIPYPRLLYRHDGLLALVADMRQERSLPGSWTALRLPSALTPPGISYSPGRQHVAMVSLTQGSPVYLRILSQYDIQWDATIWRLDAWTGGRA